MLIFIIQIGYRASVYFGDEETQKVGQIVVLASMCLTQIKVSGLSYEPQCGYDGHHGVRVLRQVDGLVWGMFLQQN